MEKIKSFLFNKFSVLLTLFIIHTNSTIPTNHNENLLLNSEKQFIVILNATTKLKNIIGTTININTLPNILPVENLKVTSKFGEKRYFPKKYNHKGMDLAGKKGTPIKATAEGKIIFAGWMYGYGKTVIIKHDNNIVTVYAHLNEINTSIGKTVNKQDVIGKLGSTGRSTGNHLHYEIRINNKPIDPENIHRTFKTSIVMEKSYILNADQLMGMKQRFEKKRNELAALIRTGKSKYLKGDLEKLNNIKENLIRIKSALAVVNLKINSRIYELNYTLEDISILHQYAKSKGMKSKEIQTNIEELQTKINSLKSDVNTYNSAVTSKISLIEE